MHSESDDSDLEESFVDCEATDKIEIEILSLLSRKPTFISTMSRNSNNLGDFKQQLANCVSISSKRSSSRLDDKKKVEDAFRELSSELTNLAKKFDSIINSVMGVIDEVEDLRSRVSELEKKSEQPRPASFARAAALPATNHDDRLEKLEYLSSEEERKRRILEITITHPSIDYNSNDLEAHTKTFLASQMKMDSRSIDGNLKVFKSTRENTIRLSFSDIRFKRFIYKARKVLRENHPQLNENLYLNEHLTTLNYNILKKLKSERDRRKDRNLANFDSIYTFEGRVYVKKNKNDDRSFAVAVTNAKSMEKFLASLRSENDAENSNNEDLSVAASSET